MLIKQVDHNSTGDNIRFGDTFTDDQFEGETPPDEQRAIVAHTASDTAKLDALRAAARRTISLLKERRAAVIAAAVTGKLRVSEPLAEEAPAALG